MKEFQAFPKIGASYFELELSIFTDENHKKQFENDMKELGLKLNEKDKLVKIMPFTYIRKDQLLDYNALMDRMENEIDEEIRKDITGTGFIKDMFEYAIAKVGFNTEDILNFIGISKEEFNQKSNLRNGLKLAKQKTITRENREDEEEMD